MPNRAGIQRGNFPFTPGTTTGRRAMQARHKDQDTGLMTKYSCSGHAVTYYASNDRKPTCPVCDAEDQLAEVRKALAETLNKNEMLHNENQKLRQQVDIVEAMRVALDLIDNNDLMFLKTVLYQWKIDRSIGLKVTHGTKKRQRNGMPNGFIAMPRGRDPEGHVCSSIGGMAIAEYYEEAMNTVGSAQAMILLVRAMAKLLPGATG